MTHKQEDIDAAEAYSYCIDRQQAFLAGCEHKQKEVNEKDAKIDELVESVMRYANGVDELVSMINKLNDKVDAYWNDSDKPDYRVKDICQVQRESYRLIQKHKP